MKINKLVRLMILSVLVFSMITAVPVSAAIDNGRWGTSGKDFYDPDGERVYGLYEIKYDNNVNRMYKFTENEGTAFTGWAKSVKNGSRYYYKSGSMVKGWAKINRQWYHFAMDGVMSSGTDYIAGQKYIFENNGIWTGKYGSSAKRPDDFEFSYESFIVQERPDGIYSKQGIVKKDLIENGAGEAGLKIPQRDMQVIYSAVLEFGVIDMCGLGYDITSGNIALAAGEEEAVDIDPNSKVTFTFAIDGTEYTLKGDESVHYHPVQSYTADRYKAFNNFMQDYLRGTDGYESLPDPVGGYN